MNEVGLLQTLGFTEAELQELKGLKQRYQRGECSEALTAQELRRLAFVRWLVIQGWLQS
jgi:hypothetical protein